MGMRLCSVGGKEVRYVPIDSVEPGHVLAKAIYASDGRILLNTGVQLTVGMINKLRNIGVTFIYIHDHRFEDIHVNEVVSEETRREAIRNVAEIIHLVQIGKNFNTANIHNTVQNIIREILINKDVLLELGEVRTLDNQQYIHALNVCLMSVVTGINLNLTHTQLYDLAIGALLHDIGKWVQEDDEHDHTWKGFNYLRKKREISILSAHVALQHHEWIDGTGYPRQVKGDDLHIFGKIVAVTNLYDNLISPSEDGEQPKLPYQACETLMGLAGKKLDHEVVRQFLRSVAIYPTGTSVKLTTGEVAIVVDQHKGLPARPVLRAFRNYNDEELPEVKVIDLAKSTTVFIEKILP
jgi:HD-GYP domain-containing protein (c-di-GMP phosphodiesterase class II)